MAREDAGRLVGRLLRTAGKNDGFIWVEGTGRRTGLGCVLDVASARLGLYTRFCWTQFWRVRPAPSWCFRVQHRLR